jgi:hypothetical protein
MTFTLTPTAIARLVCLTAGAAIAALVLMAARPAHGVPELPASVSFSVAPTGELEVTPSAQRPVLNAPALSPLGKPASASFIVRNQTAETLLIGFHGHPDTTALDGLVQVRLSSGRQELARTTLQGLRAGSDPSLRLPSGGSRRVRLETWIPRSVSAGYQGIHVHVSLTPTSARARG